jgi:hypothetical protein
MQPVRIALTFDVPPKNSRFPMSSVAHNFSITSVVLKQESPFFSLKKEYETLKK